MELLSFVKRPGVQLVHAVCRVLGCARPRGQASQEVVPVRFWNLPAPHARQLAEPSWSAYVPSSHAVQKAAPVDDVRPTAHERHVVAFLVEYWPASHLVHEVCFGPE